MRRSSSTRASRPHSTLPNVSWTTPLHSYPYLTTRLISDLSEMHCKRSALALVDGHTPWDIHRPLTDSCTVQLLHFTIVDPHLVNRAFWRTCSFLLGAALQNCFKSDAGLQLHSFPSPNVKTGSFVHDVALKVPNWEPSKRELQAISAEMIKLSAQDVKIERLSVGLELAVQMFQDNPYKLQHLPNIAAHSNDQVSLYRVGDHVDISKGPMVATSSLLGKCTVSSVHQLPKQDDGTSLYRVQGVALPAGITMNHVMFNVLEERSKKLNPARLPNEPYEESSIEAQIA